MASEPWIDKYALARRLGLLNAKGEPQVYGINRKCKSGEWDSHIVLGQLRFSPEDVAAIEQKLRHPSTAARPKSPPPAQQARKRDKTKRGKTAGQPAGVVVDLEDRPIRVRPPRDTR